MALAAFPTGAGAQNAALYDPQPPADSAYVRVLLGSASGPTEVTVDGKARIAQVSAAEPSDYMVLSAGKHKVTVHNKSKASAVDIPIDVVAGRATTIVLPEVQAGVKPVLLDDKSNGNKLKAMLAVYHINSKLGPLDILSADGATRVFSKVAPGGTASLAVNPLTIDLIATKPDDKAALGTVSLALNQGASYSIVVAAGDGGKTTLKVFANKVERYTGK